jgi:tetratricopeptide (TPR) repeat protein
VDPTLCFNLAILLEDLERRDEAIAAYRCALRGDPRFADCHYNLGLAYQAAGNALAAIRHLREYRKLSSTLTPGSRRPSD